MAEDLPSVRVSVCVRLASVEVQMDLTDSFRIALRTNALDEVRMASGVSLIVRPTHRGIAKMRNLRNACFNRRRLDQKFKRCRSVAVGDLGGKLGQEADGFLTQTERAVGLQDHSSSAIRQASTNEVDMGVMWWVRLCSLIKPSPDKCMRWVVKYGTPVRPSLPAWRTSQNSPRRYQDRRFALASRGLRMLPFSLLTYHGIPRISTRRTDAEGGFNGSTSPRCSH